MKLLVYPGDLAVGGVQHVAIDLAAAVRDRGHEVVFYARTGPLAWRLRNLGLDLHVEDEGPRRASPRQGHRVAELAEQVGADVVHAYGARPAVNAFFGPHLIGRRAVVMTMLPMPHRTVPGYLPRSLPLVVGRRSFAEMLRARRSGPVVAIRTPIDVDPLLPNRAQHRAFRAEHDIDDGAAVILVVSRLPRDEPWLRPVLVAIDAMAHVRGRATMVVVGDGDGRTEVEAWAGAVNARTARRSVVLLGELPDVSPAYAGADLVLAMATSALRGMATARPTIVLGPSGHFELFDHDTLANFLNEGVFAAPGDGAPDPRVLAAMLDRLLADASAADAIGAFARRAVEEHWSAGSAAAQLERVYDDVVATPTALSIQDALATSGRYLLATVRSVAKQGRDVLRGTLSHPARVFHTPREALRPADAGD